MQLSSIAVISRRLFIMSLERATEMRGIGESPLESDLGEGLTR